MFEDKLSIKKIVEELGFDIKLFMGHIINNNVMSAETSETGCDDSFFEEYMGEGIPIISHGKEFGEAVLIEG